MGPPSCCEPNQLNAFIEEEKVRVSDILPVDGDCYANMKAKKGKIRHQCPGITMTITKVYTSKVSAY